MASAEKDQETWTKKFTEMLGQGGAILGVSVGTKLGLFKALADLATSSSDAVDSQKLADSIGFKERYVREWLGIVASAGIIDHHAVDDKDLFWIEPFRHQLLLGTSMVWPAQYCELFVACAEAQDKVAACFPLGGPSGTHVDDHPGIHLFLQRARVIFQTPSNANLIIDEIPGLKDKLVAGLNVLEMGCGTAHLTKALATLYPSSKFTALELSEEVLERARSNCKDLTNVNYMVADACHLPEDMAGAYDLIIVCDVLHDLAYPNKFLAGIHRALKDDGQLLLNDVDVDSSLTLNKKKEIAPFYYAVSCHYCIPTCLNDPNGAALGACAGTQKLEALIREAGFVSVKRIAEKIDLYYICNKK